METECSHLCPHCGNETILGLINEIELDEAHYDLYNNYEGTIWNYYFLLKCSTCCRVSIYVSFYVYPEKGGLRNLQLIFPRVKDIDWFLPNEIECAYSEAKRVQKLSINSFIVLIRKSLELVCSDQKATGHTLQQKINDLLKKGIMPDKIARLANMIREVGNRSAHVNDGLDLHDVEEIEEFFSIIVQYIYGIDKSIEAFRKKWTMTGSD